MIRKWMAMLFSLLLAAVLPFGALADRQHTLTVDADNLLSAETGLTELLDVLDLRLTEGDKSGELAIFLNDQELVALGLMADATGLYAQSDLFGADVLFITWEDASAMLMEQMAAAMQEAGADETMLQSMEAGFAEIKNELVSAAGAGAAVAVQPSAPVTVEENLRMIEEMFPDDPQMQVYFRNLYEGMTVENGTFAAEDRDTADQKHRMVMDAEDLAALCDTNHLKTTLLESMAMEMPEASEAELAQAAEQVMKEVRTLFEQSGYELIMEMYTLDEGQTLVGLDMTMRMALDDGEQRSVMLMDGRFDRLTDGEGVSYRADFMMAADGEQIQLAVELDRAYTGETTGMLGMLAGGEEIVLLYDAENIAMDTRVRTASLYMRSGATAVLKPAASARPLISVTVTTEPAPEEVLSSLENATMENSVNVLSLTEAEMQQLGNQITMNATQVLYTALGQMPTSTLNLFLSLMDM